MTFDNLHLEFKYQVSRKRYKALYTSFTLHVSLLLR